MRGDGDDHNSQGAWHDPQEEWGAPWSNLSGDGEMVACLGTHGCGLEAVTQEAQGSKMRTCPPRTQEEPFYFLLQKVTLLEPVF